VHHADAYRDPHGGDLNEPLTPFVLHARSDLTSWGANGAGALARFSRIVSAMARHLDDALRAIRRKLDGSA